MSGREDILDRLRTVSGCTQKTFMHRIDWEDGRQILAEAVAEIERLRKQLAETSPVENETSRDWAVCRAVDLYREPRNKGDERTLADFLADQNLMIGH